MQISNMMTSCYTDSIISLEVLVWVLLTWHKRFKSNSEQNESCSLVVMATYLAPGPFLSKKQISQLVTTKSEREGPDWNRRTFHIVKKIPQ